MCWACWRDEGSPVVFNEKVARGVELVHKLYELEPLGGPLHVVVDDWNVEDGDLVPMYEIPAIPSLDVPHRPDRYSPEVHAVCDELAVLLTGLSMDERLSVLAHSEGFAANGTAREN